MAYNTFSFKVTTTSMWFFKIGSFPSYFTRIPPPPLLLRLGFAPWVVSPDVDLFKWCQKKRITKVYNLKLGTGCQPGLRKAKTTMSIAILFRSWLLWYFRLSMLPLQLWIHLSKSLEISHEEDRDKRESTQSVYFPFSGDVELSCGSLFQFKLIL